MIISKVYRKASGWVAFQNTLGEKKMKFMEKSKIVS